MQFNRVNKRSHLSSELKSRIISLYFDGDLSVNEVAAQCEVDVSNCVFFQQPHVFYARCFRVNLIYQNKNGILRSCDLLFQVKIMKFIILAIKEML